MAFCRTIKENVNIIMDRCGEHKDRQLRDYFLNRLTPEEVEDFQFHLFHCETCRMNLERMRLLAHDCRDEATSAFDAEKSNAKKRRLTFPHSMRKSQTLKNVV